jgi:hypothetical protein
VPIQPAVSSESSIQPAEQAERPVSFTGSGHAFESGLKNKSKKQNTKQKTSNRIFLYIPSRRTFLSLLISASSLPD